MARTPINLNKIRKARARDARKREADRNAVVHGMTLAERQRLKKEDARWKARVDGAHREGQPADPDKDGTE